MLTVPGVAESGQSPPDPPRLPLQELMRTEVVYPQEKGEFQMTLGSTADKRRNGSVLALPLQAEYGLTDAWQVEVGFGTFSRVRTGDLVSSGRGAFSIGTKYSFMRIKGSPVHAAVGLDAEFAGGLGPDGSREDAREVEPFVALAVDLRPGLQAFFHTARSFAMGAPDVDGGDESVEPSAAVQWNAGALQALRRYTLACELNARTDGSPWRRGAELYATPSITFLLPTPWEIGLGVPIGLNGRSDHIGVAVHVIYER